MMTRATVLVGLFALFCSSSLQADEASDVLPDGGVVLDAMAAELARSMELRMEDLEQPYYIRYTVRDGISYSLSAGWGVLNASSRSRSRNLAAHVRVGSPELDNTNFAGGRGGFFGFGFGGRSGLPVDDDLVAIRHAIWSATDDAYKEAVETLTNKRAHLEDVTIEDRPFDFSEAQVVEHSEPLAQLAFDRAAWEQRLAEISARFREHPSVQDASVALRVGAGNRFIVDSEGTRLRSPSRSARLSVTVSTQGPDGQRLQDGLQYTAREAADLPAVEEVVADIDALVTRLVEIGAAAMLDSYTGPVLLQGTAAPRALRSLLAAGLAAVPEPVGSRRGGDGLEKKLGTRILPRSFLAWDDPTVPELDGVALAGHYLFDDEGVEAQRVPLVEGGKLLDLVASRAPTKKVAGSNGHGRSAGFPGSTSAAIGNLFFEDEAGISEEELLEELRSAAADEGLEFGLLVTGFSGGGIQRPRFGRARASGQVKLPDPLDVHKVYVEDGRTERVRRLEFAPMAVRALKRLLAAGQTPFVHNAMGGDTRAASSAVIAPALLFEELELSKIEQELDKLPLLTGPLQR